MCAELVMMNMEINLFHCGWHESMNIPFQGKSNHTGYTCGAKRSGRHKKTSAFAKYFCDESLEKPVDEQRDLINLISEMLDKHLPTKTSKKRFDELWLTTDLKRKCHKKQCLYNKWKSSKPETSHVQQPEMQTRSPILTQVTSCRKIGWSTSTTSWAKAWKRRRIDHSGNTLQRTEVTSLKEKDQVDSYNKASIFARQCRTMFTVDDHVSASTYLHDPRLLPIPEVSISEQGIENLPKGVNLDQASGPDQIPWCMV